MINALPITKATSDPAAGMPVPPGASLLFQQQDIPATRVGFYHEYTNLYASDDAKGTYASLDNAIAAAQALSAGDADGVVVLKAGPAFALHGATQVSRITESSGVRGPLQVGDRITPIFTPTLYLSGHLDNLNPALAAVIDGDKVLVPTVTTHAGTHLRERVK